MSSGIDMLSDVVSEIFYSVAATGVLSLSDYYKLIGAALNDSLNEQELGSINRMLHFVQRRKIAIVDDISTWFGNSVSRYSDYTELNLPMLQVTST